MNIKKRNLIHAEFFPRGTVVEIDCLNKTFNFVVNGVSEQTGNNVLVGYVLDFSLDEISARADRMMSSDVVFEKDDTGNFKFIPIGDSETDKDSEAALKAIKTFADLAVCIDWKTSFSGIYSSGHVTRIVSRGKGPMIKYGWLSLQAVQKQHVPCNLKKRSLIGNLMLSYTPSKQYRVTRMADRHTPWPIKSKAMVRWERQNISRMLPRRFNKEKDTFYYDDHSNLQMSFDENVKELHILDALLSKYNNDQYSRQGWIILPKYKAQIYDRHGVKYDVVKVSYKHSPESCRFFRTQDVEHLCDVFKDYEEYITFEVIDPSQVNGEFTSFLSEIATFIFSAEKHGGLLPAYEDDPMFDLTESPHDYDLWEHP